MGPKKQKQTMSLGTFLGDQSLGSWADEMEDTPITASESKGYSSQRRDFQSGPRPEREDRFPPREPLPLPNAPPYTAHLGNLSFDVTAGDIEDFFSGCEVTNVRIVEDKIDHKPKGFGYVEFKTLDGLKSALAKSGTSFQNRQVRVSVADPPKDRPEQRSFDDWTRKGPLPDLPQNARRTSAGPPGRSFDNYSDAGSERGGGLRMERGGGGSRRGAPAFDGDGKPRDFGNWERKGPPTPIERAPPSREGRPSRNLDRGLDRSFERKASPAWGEGKSQDSGSRPPRPVPERQPTAAEMDTQWRARMRPDPPAKEEKPSRPESESSQPSSPAPAAAAPAPTIRPKLNLQKRTVSNVPAEVNSATSATDSKASPFGSARPIDTATKEAAIAEKREAQRKQREEEDKAKADKATEKKTPRDSVPSTPTAGGVQENGASSSRGKRGEQQENGDKPDDRGTGRQYEILRRMGNEEGEAEVDPAVAAAAGGEERAEGRIVDDKNVKPKEVVRPIGGSEAKPSAEGLEEEGWSTIPTAKEKRGHRKRNSMAAARALAS